MSFHSDDSSAVSVNRLCDLSSELIGLAETLRLEGARRGVTVVQYSELRDEVNFEVINEPYNPGDLHGFQRADGSQPDAVFREGGCLTLLQFFYHSLIC